MKSALYSAFNHIQMLSSVDERNLLIKYRSEPSKALADKIIMSNWRFVLKLANKWGRRYNASEIDLFQEGIIGMMRALGHYDVAKADAAGCTRFVVYAAHFCAQAMRMFIIKNYTIVKNTSVKNKKVFFYKRTPEQLARGEYKALPEREASLDASFDDGKGSFHDIVADSNLGPDKLYEKAVSKQFMEETLADMLSGFNDREKVIINERYLNENPLCLHELGDKLGVSRERVRQVEERLLDKMKQKIVSRNLKAELMEN